MCIPLHLFHLSLEAQFPLVQEQLSLSLTGEQRGQGEEIRGKNKASSNDAKVNNLNKEPYRSMSWHEWIPMNAYGLILQKLPRTLDNSIQKIQLSTIDQPFMTKKQRSWDEQPTSIFHRVTVHVWGGHRWYGMIGHALEIMGGGNSLRSIRVAFSCALSEASTFQQNLRELSLYLVPSNVGGFFPDFQPFCQHFVDK